MMKIKILGDRRRLLFIVSLCVTVGGWIMSLGSDWHAATTPAAIGGLFILLGNNVFSNAVKNIGLMGSGVTNESDPETRIGGGK